MKSKTKANNYDQEEDGQKEGGKQNRTAAESSPSSPLQEARHLGPFHGTTHHGSSAGKAPSIDISGTRK